MPRGHAEEYPESAPGRRRFPKRAWRARGGPTGRHPGFQGITSYVILPRPVPAHG